MSSDLVANEAGAGSAPRGPAAAPKRILTSTEAGALTDDEKTGFGGAMRTAADAVAGPVERAGRTLREAVRLLREARPPLWSGLVGDAPSDLEPEIAEGARFEKREFSSDAGGRDYRLYVPSPAAGTPRALILMLHGCKQNSEDFAIGTGMNDQAEAEGLVLVYPRQPSARNASSCWNWFRASDQGRDEGEPAILAGMTRAVAEEFGIPPERIFVAGLSAGGSMAAILAETYPDLFAAAGIHSGVPTGVAKDLSSALAAMRGKASPEAVPDESSDGSPGGSAAESLAGASGPTGRRIVFHGIEDDVVHSANAGRLLPAAIRAAPRQVGRTEGGRVYHRLALESGDGRPESELWLIEGAGHAWSGGRSPGSFTDPAGPDASAEMVRFFLGRP
ncbi:alpha/beta hydrolase family esterase [Amaricoccus sp. W119]|uniref:extracellular catalytic domain type 1 short-chain-length polyhydroxyalkanoate depolymerase n=1 Tax=Amaricoccus sp. W119 TaxID=3391833 RepID=UPI0039A638F9